MIDLLLALSFLGQAAAAPVTDQWTYKEATDPATGKKSASAQVRNAGGARLIVRCDTANKPIISVQFLPRPALAASDEKQVQIYYDEGRVETSSWEFPGTGGYLAQSVDVFLMVSGIAGSKSVRLDILNGKDVEPTEGVFKGPGSDAMFRQVYAACGFPFQKPAVPKSSD